MSNEFEFPVVPFYICIDASASMEGTKIASLNSALLVIHQWISSDPIVNEKVRVCVITFSESAEVFLPLSKMSEVAGIPHIEAKERTNYRNAFTCLLETIQADITKLKFLHEKIQRPLVFFISDGGPTDTNWQTAHAAVIDKKWSFAPHIITFGIKGLSAETLQKIATSVGKSGNKYVYLADDDYHLAVGLKDCIKELTEELNSVPWNPKRTIALTPVHSTIPVYLVLEESSALSEHSISAINQAIPEIYRVISIDPLMNESVRVCIVSFSDSTEVLLPLSNLSDVEEFPGLVAKGSANFQELFLALQKVLADDLSKLPQSINQYERPIVFIIAASNPNDESWREPLADLLIDPRFHNPHIVVLGAGETSASTMTDIATTSPAHHHRMAYRLTETSHPADIIRESLKTLYFETL